jgi:hypothetical protein
VIPFLEIGKYENLQHGSELRPVGVGHLTNASVPLC